MPKKRVYATVAAGISRSQRPASKNAAGIWLLDESIRAQVFGSTRNSTKPEMLSLVRRHLSKHDLLGQKTSIPPPLDIDLPPLLGDSLDEHFQKIGQDMCEPFLSLAKRFIDATVPVKPSKWVMRSGWVRYTAENEPESVAYPSESAIVFDTEVLYHVHPFPVLATAVSDKAWYAWTSPWLLGETEDPKHLVPLGNDGSQVVIGHNVGYDRKLVREEYNIKQSEKFWLDTMSLHIATHGMCSRQRPTFLKLQKATTGPPDSAVQRMLRSEPWFGEAATNGLSEVLRFILGETMDKSARNWFGELSREGVVEKFQELVTYCATDSYYTKRIFDSLLPEFLTLCPHPVSFGSLRAISAEFLPVNEKWEEYVVAAEKLYQESHLLVCDKLEALARAAVASVDSPESDALEEMRNDPWLGQLNWTIKAPRYTKAKPGAPSRLAKNQKLPGKPQWFKDLFPRGESQAMNLTVRSRVTPLLLRLRWDGHPLVWYDKHGWGFWTPIENQSKYEGLSYACVPTESDPSRPDQLFFKLPHPDGELARCTNPLAKSYLSYFEKGVLTSDNEDARRAIESSVMSSYWISARARIQNQVPVYVGQADTGSMGGMPKGWGLIIPRIVPMGTVTRRAVEDTWLTASNAKKNRTGSELKAMVRAPPGYTFIGADVDSEELWIASVLGDSLVGMHGGTALGWMTLEGDKKSGTDLHSKTAQILGISRNEAKIFNYGRIYGAGKSFATRLLRQFNPELSVTDAQSAAQQLYDSTKGRKTNSRTSMFPLSQYWRAGTESIVFNQLELLAHQAQQCTPILGAGITAALSSKNLNRNNAFLTSRVNWSIQSSGVDYLHLMIAAMHYLCEVYGLSARLLLTVHDDVRYLAKEHDADRVALALQIANMWTRAMFCQQLGMDNMPHSVAFFSSIDVDTVLRKEVNDPCVTPSHPSPLPPGESLDISALLHRCSSLGEPDPLIRGRFLGHPTTPRRPVMQSINYGPSVTDYAEAQIVSTNAEAGEIEARIESGAEPVYETHGTPLRSHRQTIKGVF